MSNVHILTKETSNIMSLIYKAKKCRRDSKASNVAGVRSYGEYLGVMVCDINLICDAIMESKKADLFEVLEDLAIWFRKMDRIAQGIK
ncbi:hypothetical protein CPL00365_CDS0057 [Klebsiella phage SmellyBerry]|uniref:Uncharacterized protein n=2 Tax=Webervirus TaxID=1920860 RepID=A0A5B9NJJ9_9CAUD|nr:hypothetical protein H1N99_gp54 [Klebsiella phage vB_KpnS_SegesCirculi]YP_009903086.1 hypothetical protein H1O07_gp78 [Klebsiella phage Skenny]WDQ26547.1 hypothetical protein phiKPNHS32_00007 [Klebsiella phage phi_KPN_HS3]HBY4082468.1 hypothetical protein [Klebsiella pneumoniae]QEG07261.1 hypothetical protein CPT_Skenny_078 [Klebsiella phage Skenny]QEG12586.1 hypothetical protein SEGES_54 [Klebsiella phage vB_KpnS_SegesCirculi]QPX75080.1 hypothetical protein [Klebsiella phage vB_KpnS_Seges